MPQISGHNIKVEVVVDRVLADGSTHEIVKSTHRRPLHESGQAFAESEKLIDKWKESDGA